MWSTLLYGCEAWTVSREIERRLEVMEMWWRRRLRRVRWTEKRSNANILEFRRIIDAPLIWDFICLSWLVENYLIYLTWNNVWVQVPTIMLLGILGHTQTLYISLIRVSSTLNWGINDPCMLPVIPLVLSFTTTYELFESH